MLLDSLRAKTFVSEEVIVIRMKLALTSAVLAALPAKILPTGPLCAGTYRHTILCTTCNDVESRLCISKVS